MRHASPPGCPITAINNSCTALHHTLYRTYDPWEIETVRRTLYAVLSLHPKVAFCVDCAGSCRVCVCSVAFPPTGQFASRHGCRVPTGRDQSADSFENLIRDLWALLPRDGNRPSSSPAQGRWHLEEGRGIPVSSATGRHYYGARAAMLGSGAPTKSSTAIGAGEIS